jgi:hypothetical protein
MKLSMDENELVNLGGFQKKLEIIKITDESTNEFKNFHR